MKKYDVQPLDLMQWINRKYHDPFIHERIELDHGLDPPRLLQAIERLADAFPLLKCRYVSAENTYVENEPFSAHDLLRIDDTADQTMLLTEALDMSKKLVQFTLTGKRLIITISHLITDGSGFKQLIYLLCDLYNGRCGEGPPHLMRREFSQLTRSLTNTRAIAVPLLLSMIGRYKNSAIYEKADRETVDILARTIKSAKMSAIHTVAKKQGATLNDVFLTAYARALGKQSGLRKLMIPCTVDLRKYASDPTGIGNLTGSYSVHIKLADGEIFRDTLKRVSAAMQKQKQTKNDIAGPMLLVKKYQNSSLRDFLKLYGGLDTGAFTDYTNLGVLDDERLRFSGATVKNAIGYSGVNKAPCFQIAISSFQGAATITSLIQCSKEGKAKAEKLMDTIVRELESFAPRSVS